MWLQFTLTDYSVKEFSGIKAIYKDGDYNKDIKHDIEKLCSGDLLNVHYNGKQEYLNGDTVRSVRFA